MHVGIKVNSYLRIKKSDSKDSKNIKEARREVFLCFF